MRALLLYVYLLFVISECFLPRDAMLARYMLWPCVRLSVRLCLSAQVGVLLKRLDTGSDKQNLLACYAWIHSDCVCETNKNKHSVQWEYELTTM